MSRNLTRERNGRDLEPVLMLVPYFAPQTHAAMFRSHKLAKYMSQFGFRPVVVTTDINYLYNEDVGLLDEMPDQAQIFRARHVEPTLRGIRMALGGKDRTFAALKAASVGSFSQRERGEGVGAVKRGALYSGLIRALGEWPDRHWMWSIAAHRLCRKLVHEQGIKLMYTSAVPTSPLRTALGLQREFGLRWVADFRDPVGYGYKHSARGVIASALERSLVSMAMRRADMVTGLADSYGKIFFDLYDLPEERFKFIPTGVDESYLTDVRRNGTRENFVLHVGEVMPNQSAYVLAVLSRLNALSTAEQSVKVVFVGREEINRPLVGSMLETISDRCLEVEFIDHLSQPHVYELMGRAKACLLAPGVNRYWWTNFAKMVDYIGIGVPVIADVPRVSEARAELEKSGNGIFIDANNIDVDAVKVRRALDQPRVSEANEHASRYTAYEQARSFSMIFSSLVNS